MNCAEASQDEASIKSEFVEEEGKGDKMNSVGRSFYKLQVGPERQEGQGRRDPDGLKETTGLIRQLPGGAGHKAGRVPIEEEGQVS